MLKLSVLRTLKIFFFIQVLLKHTYVNFIFIGDCLNLFLLVKYLKNDYGI